MALKNYWTFTFYSNLRGWLTSKSHTLSIYYSFLCSNHVQVEMSKKNQMDLRYKRRRTRLYLRKNIGFGLKWSYQRHKYLMGWKEIKWSHQRQKHLVGSCISTPEQLGPVFYISLTLYKKPGIIKPIEQRSNNNIQLPVDVYSFSV